MMDCINQEELAWWYLTRDMPSIITGRQHIRLGHWCWTCLWGKHIKSFELFQTISVSRQIVIHFMFLKLFHWFKMRLELDSEFDENLSYIDLIQNLSFFVICIKQLHVPHLYTQKNLYFKNDIKSFYVLKDFNFITAAKFYPFVLDFSKLYSRTWKFEAFQVWPLIF